MQQATEAIPVAVYGKQAACLASTARVVGFVAGRGAGKTETGALWLLKRARAGRFYMVVSDTYPRLKDAAIRTFLRIARQLDRLRSYNKTDHLAVISTEDGGEAEIRFRSCDKPDTLRGPNVADIWIDEASLITDEDYANVCACGGRDGGGDLHVLLTFTPKGKRHWTYSEFYTERLDSQGRNIPREDAELFHAHSRENIFLSDQWATRQERLYTSTMAKQEMAGEFVDMAGLLFQRAWFGYPIKAHQVPVPARLRTCVYWDKAATHGSGCYSQGGLYAFDPDGYFYVLKECRGQWSPDERNKKMYQAAAACARKFNHSTINAVEKEGGSGGVESALATVKLLAGFSVRVDDVTGKKHRMVNKERLPGEAKMVRAQGVAAYAENGLVRLVADYPVPGWPDSDDSEALTDRRDWTDRWLDEITLFPEYKHMDRVDSLSGGFNILAGSRFALGPGQQEEVPMTATTGTQPIEFVDTGVKLASNRTQSHDHSRYGVRFSGRGGPRQVR